MKRKLAFAVAAVCSVGCLMGCFQEQPGTPTVSGSSQTVWSDTMPGTATEDMGTTAAIGMCNQLVAEFRCIASRFAVNDLSAMKENITLLNTYLDNTSEESLYFVSLRSLYCSLYSFYTGNCTRAACEAKFVACTEAFDALPKGIRAEFQSLDSGVIAAALDNVESLAASRSGE